MLAFFVYHIKERSERLEVSEFFLKFPAILLSANLSTLIEII